MLPSDSELTGWRRNHTRSRLAAVAGILVGLSVMAALIGLWCSRSCRPWEHLRAREGPARPRP